MSISKPKLWERAPSHAEGSTSAGGCPGASPLPAGACRDGPGAGQCPANRTPAPHRHRTPAAPCRDPAATGRPGGPQRRAPSPWCCVAFAVFSIRRSTIPRLGGPSRCQRVPLLLRGSRTPRIALPVPSLAAGTRQSSLRVLLEAVQERALGLQPPPPSPLAQGPRILHPPCSTHASARPRVRSPAGPGTPAGVGTLAGETARSEAQPWPAQPRGRAGVSSSRLVLGTACLVLGTACRCRDRPSLRSGSCQEPLLPQWVCAELVRNKQLLQRFVFHHYI